MWKLPSLPLVLDNLHQCLLLVSANIVSLILRNFFGTSNVFVVLIVGSLLRNFGGVFGLAQGSGWLFGLISIGLLVGVSAYLIFSPTLERYEYICFGFVVGGGASNITDRLVYGSVIDFIDIQQIPFWHYVFNTADVMIHLGIWPLLIISFVLNKNATNRATDGS